MKDVDLDGDKPAVERIVEFVGSDEGVGDCEVVEGPSKIMSNS